MILQNAATTGNGTVADCGDCPVPMSVYVEWHSACTAGQVTLKTARRGSWDGEWAVVAVVDFVPNTVILVKIDQPLAFLMAPVTSNITGTGASVTVELVGGNQ